MTWRLKCLQCKFKEEVKSLALKTTNGWVVDTCLACTKPSNESLSLEEEVLGEEKALEDLEEKEDKEKERGKEKRKKKIVKCSRENSINRWMGKKSIWDLDERMSNWVKNLAVGD